MNIKGVLFVEIYVGMAKMVAWWHQMALGFTLKGIKEKKGQHGLEITYWLQHGEVNILITSALEPAANDVVSFVDHTQSSTSTRSSLSDTTRRCAQMQVLSTRHNQSLSSWFA